MLLEHTVVPHLSKHTDTYSILTALQHDFHKKHLTVSQLILTISDLAKYHDHLQHCGVRGKMTYSLLKDWLPCGTWSSILPNVTFCQRKEMGTSLYTSTHYVDKYYNR